MNSSFKVEILSTKVVSKIWSTFSEVTLNYTRRDGRTEQLVREVNDHGAAAGILALDPRRKTENFGHRKNHVAVRAVLKSLVCMASKPRLKKWYGG